MRNRFSELIEKGVASFSYTPITQSVPEQDNICRVYNNIFSIPTDTHMSCLDDGTRVITGHMIATPKWEQFIGSWYWGAVDFRQSGAWCLSCFLSDQGLKGEKGILNGDIVYYIKPITYPPDTSSFDNTEMDLSKVVTSESQIPQPITTITVSGNIMHIKECFEGVSIYDAVKKLNQSSYIKGDHWTVSENSIIGLIGDTVYKIK